MKRLGSRMFIVAMIFAVVLMTIGTIAAPTSSHALAAGQQIVAVGGTACEFAGGFAVGLGVAGLFGCAVCGAGALVLGAARLLMC